MFTMPFISWLFSGSQDQDEKTLRFAVEEIIVHNAYDNDDLDYDVCLLRLTKTVDLTKVISPICLPPQGMEEDLLIGKVGNH